jgi:predicted dehydrogenase
MTQELPALVVGCGAVGSQYDEGRAGDLPLTHAGAYRAHEATRLDAGVDPDPDARRRFEEHWGIPCYPELDAALAEHQPTIISVCTPFETHLAVVDQALGAGARALWVEKPLATTHSEGEKMVAACARAGAALQVNFLRRFDPFHQSVAKILDNTTAPLLHADFRFSGSLRDFGSHAFDLFRWFTGEPGWVRAVRLPTGEPVVLLGAPSGVTASFTRVPAESIELFECYLFTSECMLSLAGLGEQLLTAEAKPSVLFRDVLRLSKPVVSSGGLEHAMIEGVDSLVSHLKSGTPLLCGGADGLAALAIQEAAEESLARQDFVPMGAA